MSEFNIDQYDNKPQDLYELLDVEPTIGDRELEAKILSMINNYKSAKARTDGNDDEYDQVIKFMIDIYKYFFEDTDDNSDGVGDNRNRVLKKYNNDSRYSNFDTVNIREDFVLPKDSTAIDTSITTGIEGQNNNSKSNITFTYPLAYATDENGLIINQATKRVVSINSASRFNPSETTSASFTLNLSETLKNVVKLKLYSISIPYSWYTISEDYGSNFFYIKGNSPGIDNETHDIKITIEPGNYTSTSLIATLNDALNHLKGKEASDDYNSINNPYIIDVSLNLTEMRYTVNSGKTKFFISIKKNYDSNYFRVMFPYITPVYDNPITNERNNTLSIPSFLGFTTNTLNSYTLYSELYGNDPIVHIDASNNNIKILRYIQNSENNFDGTNVLKTINLVFSDGIIDDISDKINAILMENNEIDNNSEYVNDVNGNYLKVKLKRDDSINHLNTKVIILLPFNESDTNKSIWTDDLKFKTDGITTYLDISYNYKILNDVISQEEAVHDRILVPSSRSIKMKFVTTKPFYGVSSDGDELNKFEMVIPTNNTGYTMDEFITTINSGFDTINTTFSDNHNTIIFNKTESSENIIRLDNNSLKLDIAIFNELGISNYLLDLSGTILGKILGEGGSSIFESKYNDFDLSNNIVTNENITINGDTIKITETGWIRKAGGYFLSGQINSINTPYILKLKPKPDGPMRELPTINVPVLPGDKYFEENNTFKADELGGLSGLTNLINDSLHSYRNTLFNKPNLLENSSISMEVIDEQTSSSKFELSLNVSDYLDETNYEMYLTDTDNNSTDTDNNIWTTMLYLDSSYNLFSNSKITVDKTIDKDVITITNTNSKIIIEPLPVDIDGGSNGVYDIFNNNTVNINIPFGNYTRNELITKINELLKIATIYDGKIISENVSFGIKTIDGKEYCFIDFNLNRFFRASDYKVVFYDNTFSSCNTGSTSIQNTTYDSTVGFILGYRDDTEYPLKSVINSAIKDVKQFISKQQLNVNLYNDFSIVLDDYNNNRLPSAVVLGTPPSTNFELPSYAKRTAMSCDENGNLLLSVKDKNNNNLTLKQLTAISSNIETSESKKSDIFKANQKIIAKDVFAVVPLNVSDLITGQLFVKEGITLQEQARSYFGPVDIQRISVKLLTDKGSLVNLNQDNWSFSFVCEQIYDKNLGQYIKNS
jgi:hypothetical protein